MLALAAHCPIGLEAVTASELAGLGLRVERVRENHGVVDWTGSLADVAAANLVLRTAERITLRLEPFRAVHFAELRRKAANVEWERWIDDDDAVIVRVTSRRSKLYHERGVAERVAGAIEDRLGRTVEVAPADTLDDPDARVQLLVVRVQNDRVTLRLDTSGPRLHRRGYRQATAKAPLRETLAASILAWSGWRPGHALVDPFCGSGTIPIEAALWAAGIAPGAGRSFRFERWPDPVQRPELVPPDELPTAPIRGSDREEGAIRAARANAERAGIAPEFVQCPVADCEPPPVDAPGWIVTNPPYARRTARGDDPLRPFAEFGEVVRSRFAGWHCTMLCPDEDSARATGLPFEVGPMVSNGGIRVRVLHLAP